MNARKWFSILAVLACLLSASPLLAIDLYECNTVCTPSCPCSLTCEYAPGQETTCGQIREWFGWPCAGFTSVGADLELAPVPEAPAIAAEPALEPALSEPQPAIEETELPLAE